MRILRLLALRPVARCCRAAAAIALFAAFLVAVPAGAQEVYTVTSATPNQLPAGNGGFMLTVNVATGSSTVPYLCFDTGYGAGATPLTPNSSTSTGNGYIITAPVPASTIQQIPASAYSDNSGQPPIFYVGVYAQDPSTAACATGVGRPDGQIVTLNFPNVASLSLSNIPDQNPNLTARIPSNVNLSGSDFVQNVDGASLVVTYSGGGITDSNTPALFVSPTEMRSTLPTNIPPGSQELMVTACNQSAGNSYCATPQSLFLYPLPANPGTLTANPAAPTAQQPVTFSADFGPPAPFAAQYGAPGGLVTFSEGNATLGTAPLVLDTTGQLTQLQSEGNASTFVSPTSTGILSYVADMNSDGVPDSIFLDPTANTFHILLGLPPYVGDNPVTPVTECGSIDAAAIADFSNDGIPDIAYLCAVGNLKLVYVMLGKGDGSSFGTPALIARGTATLLAAGDFNHDGLQDFVIGEPTTTGGNGTPAINLTTYVGDGTGAFTVQDASGPFAAVPTQLLASDLNGDGATDLVLLASAGGQGPGVYVFQNIQDGNGHFGQFGSPLQPINGSFSTVLVTPLQAKPYAQAPCTASCTLPSLIAVDTTNSQLLAAVNTSTASTLSYQDGLRGTRANALTQAAAGDFNGDGLVDVAIFDSSSGSPQVQVLTGDGNGAFSGGNYPSLNDSTIPAGSILVAAPDENGDGFADLLALSATPSCTSSCTYSEIGDVTAGTATATFNATSGFAPGAHTITAATPGTYTINGGSATTSFTVPNNLVTPVVTLTAAPASGSAYGTPAMLQAALSGTTVTPTGTVTFFDGATQVGSVTLPAALTIDAGLLTAGTHALSAVYSGDGNYTAATGTLSYVVAQATPSITWTPNPASIPYRTALGAGQLDATSPVAGAFAYTPAAGTVLDAGTQTLSAVFTPTDTINYKTVTVTATITVTPAIPTVTWTPNPATIVYGTPLGAGQLDATSPCAGTFAYTPAAGAVLNAGTQTLSAVFTPISSNYQQRTVTTTITVTQATPSITWTPNPTTLTYGTALSAAQLDATSSVAGAFAYTPAAGAVLSAGTQTLSAVFTPTSSNYQQQTVTATITITQATPSITWTPNPATIPYGTALTSAQLDATSPVAGAFAYTPAAGAILNAGTQTLTAVFTPTDTQNYKSVTSTATITVNQATPSITWTPNPATIPYGTALTSAQLDATSAIPGTFTYTPAAGTILNAGNQTLIAVFTPTSPNQKTTTTTATITVTQATPKLTWPTPADIVTGTPLSAAQLDATATGVTNQALPGSFAYTPPSGTKLTAGAHQLTTVFTPADAVNYTTATANVSINVIGVTLASVSPNTALLGDPDKTITLTGTGFLPNSSVLVGVTPIATTYVSPTMLKAVIPAADFLTVVTLKISVFDPTQAQTTNAISIPVTPPTAAVVVSGPATTQTGLEPDLTFQLVSPYPVTLEGEFTLTFAPANGSPDDPMIRFASSGTNTTDPTGRTFGFSIPANTTTTPLVMLQSGSTAGTITVTLTLTAGGVNVTPPTLQPVVITAPDQVPGVTSVSLSASGQTLTVVVRGYSNTRELTQANFHFDAAPGKSISTKDLQIDETTLFTQWYASAISAQYGSTFTYTQTFTLDEDASVVGAVQVTLTNSVGASAQGSSE